MSIRRWDIFCTVVDNFGDIGVCWRLARQLVQEHGLHVRLWVDDLNSFACIQPGINPALSDQLCAGVNVCYWRAPFPPTEPADVVIEAFACELPADYVARMRATRPLWINLEYLSAEDWVEGCHGLVSPQAGLAKYFFFPGFSHKTGGVLGEAAMRVSRANWSEADRIDWLSRYAVVAPAARVISLFAYENMVLGELLARWQAETRPVHVFLPEGRLLPQVRSELDAPCLKPGETLRRGALTLTCLPMLPQDEYDRLLWSCDINFVRGEDSFVRAQWAARPLVWHIYPQDDEAHHQKLLAFLDQYCMGMDAATAAAMRNFCLAWNGEVGVANEWSAFNDAWPLLQEHAQTWTVRLTVNGDLATNLVNFVSDKVQ